MTKHGGTKYKKTKALRYNPEFIATFIIAWQNARTRQEAADNLSLSLKQVSEYASRFRSELGIELRKFKTGMKPGTKRRPLLTVATVAL